MLKLFRRNSGDLKMRRPISIADAVFPASDLEIFKENRKSLLARILEKDVEIALTIFLANAYLWITTGGVVTLEKSVVCVTIFVLSLGVFLWRLHKKSDEHPIKKMFNDFFERTGIT